MATITDPPTTIKVPTSVRDKVKERAESLGITQAEVIERLVDASVDPAFETHVAEAMERWKPLLDRLA